MYDTHFYILTAIALFLLLSGTVMHTSNLASALIFKFIPIVSAFTLGLMAFKVI